MEKLVGSFQEASIAESYSKSFSGIQRVGTIDEETSGIAGGLMIFFMTSRNSIRSG